jgi:hypothetical protein
MTNQTEHGTSACCEPGRWVPLALFVLVVILSLDYHSLLLA